MVSAVAEMPIRMKFDPIFDQIDAQVQQAYKGLLAGDLETCGRWMTENHHLLQEIGVSSPILDKLVDAATHTGAYGAKLSGAGVGGNVIALVPPGMIEPVSAALKEAGAIEIIQTVLE